MMSNKKSTKSTTFWICIFILIAFAGWIVVYVAGLNINNAKILNPSPRTTSKQIFTYAITVTPSVEMAGWKTYTDSTGFSLKYPAYWILETDRSLEENPKNVVTSLTFTISSNDSPQQTLVAQIDTNADSPLTPKITLGQWIEALRQDQIIDKTKNITIDGYPAVEADNSSDQYYYHVDYYVIAPGRGVDKAQYTFSLNNINKYFYNTPFVQEQIKNFTNVVLSTKFPQK